MACIILSKTHSCCHCHQKQGHKQTKCKTCIYWITNTLSKLHTGPSQWPPKFYLETSKEIGFFIIKRFEVFRGSNRFDLTFLIPLASLLKVFKPTQITRSDFLDTIVPFDKTRDMNITHWLPSVIVSRILQKTTPIPYVIDLVNSIDCCSPLEFPKLRYSFL
jgi:hypothetical protein